ncbi:MAG: T9SS type A sorting domain-containing protein [Chitinophagaceae bacterium]|nr:MAG: T9SS type A sorting domain-containing protein [Chitinophagaceae bacterium]
MKISTLVGRYFIALSLSLTVFTSIAQTAPGLKFRNPVLINGTAGREGAEYKFSNVYTAVDGTVVNAIVKVKKLVNGATLVNIDETSTGYSDAWQPVVGGPTTKGTTSYIEWEIRFHKTNGDDYTIPQFVLSAVDVDGDNVRMREFIGTGDATNYTVPGIINSLLNIAPVTTTAGLITRSMGPIVNRTDIDTSSLDVAIAFNFTNTKKFKLVTGAYADPLGGNGSAAGNRFNSVYFKPITATYSLLPVKYSFFNAAAVNKTAVLNWATEIEINHDHFEVERSFDQSSFSTVGYVLDGIKDAYSTNYAFKDNSNELKGQTVAYYRLKQVDVDGRAHYSEVRKVKFSEEGVTVTTYPNPFTENVTINFNTDVAGTAEVRIVALNGTISGKKSFEVEKGNNTITIDQLSKLNTGVYILHTVVNGKVIDSRKLLKK